MDTKELVERLNDLIDYLGPASGHEDEIATAGAAIATVERLERERDEARAEAADIRARLAKMVEALKYVKRVAGDRSEKAWFRLDMILEEADAALADAPDRR